MPSVLSDPNLPRELRRRWLTSSRLDQPRNDAQRVIAQQLDATPSNEPLNRPVPDKTNVSSTQPNAEAQSSDQTPSSPRPTFRSLPPSTKQTPGRLLFSSTLQPNAQTVFAPYSGSNTQPEPNLAGTRGQNSAEEPFPTSSIQPSLSTSAPGEQSENNDENDPNTINTTHPSTLNPKTQPPKQQIPPRTTRVPTISTTKSAIPPTFTPNASPSFVSPANTKPKHKSPLGSQPPILAAESSAKPSSPRPSIADLNKAAHNLATVGFLEPRGLLEQYIRHSATPLIEDALRQFEQEEPLRVARESDFRCTSLVSC
jgi:hypothetical protein